MDVTYGNKFYFHGERKEWRLWKWCQVLPWKFTPCASPSRRKVSLRVIWKEHDALLPRCQCALSASCKPRRLLPLGLGLDRVEPIRQRIGAV